ncbi:MAG: SUMF1/EgtB/PvdO family nonheme iron enzyme [Opitutales bacterium]
MMKKHLLIGLSSFLFASLAMAQTYNIDNVAKAIEDMSKDSAYPKKYAEKLAQYKADYASKKDSKEFQDEFDAFAQEALLQNPLVQKHKEWIFIKRDNKTPAKMLTPNWQGNVSLTKHPGVAKQYNDALYKMDITKPNEAELFFKPDTKGITDVDVNWDNDKLLYSSVNDNNAWQIYEYDFATKKARPITVEKYVGVDNFDGVYLPDGNMIYMSTASYNAVPCVNGNDYVSSLYKLDPRLQTEEELDNSIRQLSFDQDTSWYPTVMNDGRIMYTRWEYTDNSHYFSRIVMKMNPDGTGQSSYYGSNSYWPNSLFYCRQIPGDSNKFIAIVSGHHGIMRSGELHLFDISKGNKEAQGRVHQYMGMGEEYIPRVMDGLVNDVPLQFIHPYPLSENYIIVSMRTSDLKPIPGKHIQKVNVKPENTFSLYLVDKFDNMTLLYTDKDNDIFEAMPLMTRTRPAAIPDRTDRDVEYGTVFLNDIYKGLGLKDVPRGTVKKLRIFEYHYAYRDTGSHETIGQESGWEVKRVHGTVDVEEDGSAMFTVPAVRPFSVQPLDADGKALALFRSWLTAQHGETLSCVGCHEENGTTPEMHATAAKKPSQNIQEWLGKARGFSFNREVQPILDFYCVECHNDSKKSIPNFKKDEKYEWKNFSNSYLALHPYVRRPGPESNQGLLSPLEFHASTSELIQILEKGHKGVNIDDKAMKVLYTWIDLNVPYHGTWTEALTTGKPKTKKITFGTEMKDVTWDGEIPYEQEELRRFFAKKYSGREDFFERDDKDFDITKAIDLDSNSKTIKIAGEEFKVSKRGKALNHKAEKAPKAEGFPFDADKAKAMIADAKLPANIAVNVGDKKMDMVLIPAGTFVQGTNDSYYDEGPAALAEVKTPFYMAKFEVTNELYAQFDAEHNSGHQDRQWKDHINPGYPANEAQQPVVRIGQTEAKAFCAWLSEKLGVKVSLPTETQWEWAARAGSDKDFWFGDAKDDYSKLENFADIRAKELAVKGVNPTPMKDPIKYYAYLPADHTRDDGNLIAVSVGSYGANPFGLHDIAGNVAEWVDGSYTKTLGGEVVEGKAVARGGSWRDRPVYGKTTLRRPYSDWQKVYNVGFRVVIEAPEAAKIK